MRLFIYGLSAADKMDKIFSNNIHCAMYLFHHKIITSTEKLKNENKKHIEGKGESYEKNCSRDDLLCRYYIGSGRSREKIETVK